MAAAELHPMGVGDILDTTFRLYRAHFVTFITIALVVYIPFGALIAAFQAAMLRGAPEIQVNVSSGSGRVITATGTYQEVGSTVFAQAEVALLVALLCGLLGGLTIALLFMTIMALCEGALVHNISAGYLGESLGAWESYSRAAPRLLPLIGARLLGGLIIMLGLVCLFVPGVIFSLWFSLVAPVVMLEKKGTTDSLGRSRELMRGNLRKGFRLILVLFVLSIIINLGVGFMVGWMPWPYPFLESFATQIIPAFLLPIQTAPWILLYYDLRIRKEAYDIERLATELAPPAAV